MLKLNNTLATWWEELTHLKRPWCWGRLRAGGEGDDRGWDGSMVSLTQWTWVWVNSGSWQWKETLAHCNPCGCKEWGTTERLNWTELIAPAFLYRVIHTWLLLCHYNAPCGKTVLFGTVLHIGIGHVMGFNQWDVSRPASSKGKLSKTSLLFFSCPKFLHSGSRMSTHMACQEPSYGLLHEPSARTDYLRLGVCWILLVIEIVYWFVLFNIPSLKTGNAFALLCMCTVWCLAVGRD